MHINGTLLKSYKNRRDSRLKLANNHDQQTFREIVTMMATQNDRSDQRKYSSAYPINFMVVQINLTKSLEI